MGIVMSTQITITLPDDIYQRARRFARLANRYSEWEKRPIISPPTP